jgi:putative methyltransferase
MIDDDGNETAIKSEKDLETRLEALSSFQLTLLLHAFKFPSAKRITYSTCSVHMQENERVVIRALESDIAKQRGWRILLRKDQVSGLREWSVRGLPEACGGDEDIAEACIRSYKDDGQGVMGFFVAGFVRPDVQKFGTSGNEGPYMRDDNGLIIRDMLGMPVLKTTGEHVSLTARDDNSGNRKEEEEEGVDVDEDEEEDEDSQSESTSSTAAHDVNARQIAFDARQGTRTDEDEWEGLED